MELITVSIEIFGVQAGQDEKHFCTTVEFCSNRIFKNNCLIVHVTGLHTDKRNWIMEIEEINLLNDLVF